MAANKQTEMNGGCWWGVRRAIDVIYGAHAIKHSDHDQSPPTGTFLFFPPVWRFSVVITGYNFRLLSKTSTVWRFTNEIIGSMWWHMNIHYFNLGPPVIRAVLTESYSRPACWAASLSILTAHLSIDRVRVIVSKTFAAHRVNRCQVASSYLAPWFTNTDFWPRFSGGVGCGVPCTCRR